MNRELIVEDIRKKILCYLQVIQDEYPVSMERIMKIKTDLNSKIHFSHGTITFFVRDNELYLPEDAFAVIDEFSKLEEYGSTNNTGVRVEDYLKTDATYMDYVKHVITDGLDVLSFYEESLLHEVMHMCGGSGGALLDEGFNELKTRELAQKYGIKIAAVGYQKEVEVAKRFEDILGTDVCSKLTFLPLEERNDYLYSIGGSDLVGFYNQVRNTMEKEGKEYSRNVSEVRNPFVKVKLYDKVSYKNTWDVIERYMNPKL